MTGSEEGAAVDDLDTNGSVPNRGNGSRPAELDELERQMERGNLFAHATLQRLSDRITGLEYTISELIEALQDAQGSNETVVEDEAEVEPASDDAPMAGDTIKIAWPSLALRQDGDGAKEATTEVNCAERMHICQAVCCKLNFALAPKEVESGAVKWDLGRPYFIRQDSDGYCTHNDRDSGFCGVYNDRPQVCRNYSCAGDDRIWTDFDNMVLNREWIDEHLKEPSKILIPDPTIRMDQAPDQGV